MIAALFLTGYIVIALACVGFGLYLSYPGHTWSTLKDSALNLLPRKSRPPAQHDEPATPVDEHSAETQYHLSVPEVAPATNAFIEQLRINNENHAETEPAEAVHDEP